MNSVWTATGLAIGTAVASVVMATAAVSSESDLFCYMVDANGQVVDLGALCGGVTAPTAYPYTPSATGTLPTPAGRSGSSAASAFKDTCVSSFMAEGGSELEAQLLCSCFAGGFDAKLSDAELAQVTQQFADPVDPPPAVINSDAVAEVVLTCGLTGGLAGW